jgi:hypothetical protein
MPVAAPGSQAGGLDTRETPPANRAGAPLVFLPTIHATAGAAVLLLTYEGVPYRADERSLVRASRTYWVLESPPTNTCPAEETKRPEGLSFDAPSNRHVAS